MLLTYYSQIQNIDKQVNLNGINSLHNFYQRLVKYNKLLLYCIIFYADLLNRYNIYTI